MVFVHAFLFHKNYNLPSLSPEVQMMGGVAPHSGGLYRTQKNALSSKIGTRFSPFQVKWKEIISLSILNFTVSNETLYVAYVTTSLKTFKWYAIIYIVRYNKI